MSKKHWLSMLMIFGGGSFASAQPEVTKTPYVVQGPSVELAGFSDEPTTTLLDAGAVDGRRELRCKPARNSIQRVVLKAKLTSTFKDDDVAKPQLTMPGMQIAADVSVRSIDADGTINYTMMFDSGTTFDDKGVDPMTTQLLRDAMKELESVTASISTSDRLITRDANFATKSQSPLARQFMDTISQSARSMSAPLPAEAVGIGASWRVTHHPIVNGVRTATDAVYTLTAMDVDVITLNVQIRLSAESQTIKMPSSDKIEMRLKSMSGTSEGSMKLNLGQLITTDASTSTSCDVTMEVRNGKTVREIAQSTTITARCYEERRVERMGPDVEPPSNAKE